MIKRTFSLWVVKMDVGFVGSDIPYIGKCPNDPTITLLVGIAKRPNRPNDLINTNFRTKNLKIFQDFHRFYQTPGIYKFLYIRKNYCNPGNFLKKTDYTNFRIIKTNFWRWREKNNG